MGIVVCLRVLRIFGGVCVLLWIVCVLRGAWRVCYCFGLCRCLAALGPAFVIAVAWCVGLSVCGCPALGRVAAPRFAPVGPGCCCYCGVVGSFVSR